MAPFGHVVGLVNDDDVPVGIFNVNVVFPVVFQGVYGDNGPVIIIKRIVVGGYAGTDTLDADGVQPGQGNGKPAPHLFLELGEHALDRNHEDPLAFSPSDQLA